MAQLKISKKNNSNPGYSSPDNLILDLEINDDDIVHLINIITREIQEREKKNAIQESCT